VTIASNWFVTSLGAAETRCPNLDALLKEALTPADPCEPEAVE
jgi:hypothetical protein